MTPTLAPLSLRRGGGHASRLRASLQLPRPSIRRIRVTSVASAASKRSGARRAQSGEHAPRAGTVGELAVTVVKSQVQNTEQQLSTLLSRQQVDAEVIHDVRVELRRLRNGLATVAPVLALPPLGSTEAGLTHALKLLGRPRDLDVLTELLQTAATRSLDERAATALSSHTKRMVTPKAQRRAVHKRLRVVATQRSAALSTADHYMRSVAHPTQTDSLLATLQRWNASPRVKSGSDAPAAAVSTLLLPSLYAVLSHHAWSVGAAKVLKPKRKMTLRGDWTRVLGVRRRHCETMHDLRKAIREARYALEAVQKTSSTVDQIHAAALQALVSRQSILGDLHDLEVLVEAICHAKAVKAMPSVVTYLQRRYRKLWKKWQQMEPLDEPTYAATLLAVLSPPREPPQEAH